MKTNSSMTLYHNSYNKEKKLDEWIKYDIDHVMWQGGKGASLNKGYEKANDVKVWIPLNQNEGIKDIPFFVGDIIVKGTLEHDILQQSDLKEDFYNITTFIKNDYGSEHMQHFFIGAK